MKKDVLVTVRGMQSIESVDGSEEVEMVAKGNYYFRNGHHFICYEEMSEGFDKPTKSMIKIADNVVEVDKKGVMNTHDFLCDTVWADGNGNCSNKDCCSGRRRKFKCLD